MLAWISGRRNLGSQCERNLLAAVRKLDKASLKQALKDLVSDSQLDALLARRDHIVRHFDEKIAALGEAAVLYELPPRVNGAAAAR